MLLFSYFPPRPADAAEYILWCGTSHSMVQQWNLVVLLTSDILNSILINSRRKFPFFKVLKGSNPNDAKCTSDGLKTLCTCTSSSLRGSPLNSGKFLRMSTVRIFSTSRSVLLRKRMMETFRKSLLLTIVSKMFMLSTRRFVLRSSIRTCRNTQSTSFFSFLSIQGFMWFLIWTGAITVGRIRFPQDTTKAVLSASSA